MARSPAAVVVLAALLASLNLAQAAALYTGDASSFINSFKNTPAISLPGAELRLVTGNDEAGAGLGLGLANMAALQFTLDPCTILQPHIHPHAELAITVSGQLHVTQNEGCEKAVVVAVFPVAGIDAYFFPYSEAYLPANTIKSFFSGLVDAGDIWTPVGTAKLDKCSCGRKL